MWEEWLNKLKRSSVFETETTPSDDIEYFISEGVIKFSQRILAEYGKLIPPNEGFVYWAGKISSNKIVINTVYAPTTISYYGGVEVNQKSNLDFVLFLSENNLMHIANVHTHPGKWVSHSEGDNYMAPFKRKGLLSIVVPCYGKKKLMLNNCGVHRFDNERFIQLSKKYKKDRFKLVKIEFKCVDSRIKSNTNGQGLLVHNKK